MRTDMPAALVIDDDEMTRVLVAETLELQGFRLEEAVDGAEGVDAFRRLHPDIVLLDVSMPHMNGFECCRQIRQLPNSLHVPIIVLTAHNDEASIASAYEAGATDFVFKPIRWQILGNRVRYLLRARRALEDLTRSEASLAFAQKLAQMGSWEWQKDRSAGYWSDEMYRILGLDGGKRPLDFRGFLERVPKEERSRVACAFATLLAEGGRQSVEHRILRPDGSQRIVLHRAEAVRTGPCDNVIKAHGTVQDITERKKREAQIEYLANYDALTDLPNRNLLHDRLTQGVLQASRRRHRLAMLFLDLDDFKAVNDSFGHRIGDVLLKLVAARLNAVVRKGDTVARLGGDEFVIVVPCQTHEDIRKIVQKVRSVFSHPFVVDGRELYVTASIGVSVFPEDGENPDALLKNADTAMYRAKEAGRHGFQFYARQMSVQAQRSMEIESALHKALENSEFCLHYQPKVSLLSGRIIGVEALIRWNAPGCGPIAPDQFIPIAEATGLIGPIGEWVLRTGCSQMAAWHAAGFTHLSVAVNLSARQFRQYNVPQVVCRTLSETGLDAAHLELELTESLLLADCENTDQYLRQTKALGVSLALDDFGTGYSSLSYLKRFPIDIIKIDRSFIRDLSTSIDDQSICRAILAMAQSLSIKTVAEGVETKDQLLFLHAHRCDMIQGYYFSPPLPVDEMTVLLEQDKSLHDDKLL